jgi:uncharacterized damage-inducible protein DinB
MSQERKLREHIVQLLQESGAHRGPAYALRQVPEDARGKRPPSLPHSLWELLEHMRIAQRDILGFSRDPGHESPHWPAGYWPSSPAPPSPQAWDESLSRFTADLNEMVALVGDPERDLFTPLPWGDGQTLLREALLVGDHNAYHLGQVVDVRRSLGAWPPTE